MADSQYPLHPSAPQQHQSGTANSSKGEPHGSEGLSYPHDSDWFRIGHVTKERFSGGFQVRSHSEERATGKQTLPC